MSERDYKAMTDLEFDELLKDSLPDQPPTDLAAAVNPFRDAMNEILLGMVLTTVTLKFLWLDVLLPTVGCLLLLLGFRSMRRENGWLRACWYLSAVRMAFTVLSLAIGSTILGGELMRSAGGWYLGSAALAAQLALYFAFWRGLKALRSRAGLEGGTGGAGALVLWQALVLALAILAPDMELGAIVLLLLYVLILISIHRLSAALDEAGYLLHPSGVKIPDGVLTAILFLAILIPVGLGWLFFCRYPMAWEEKTPVSQQAEEVKVRLAELGVPEGVLEDLTEEELLTMQDAKRAVRGRDRDESGLCYTGVAVELAGEPERWQLIHHLSWEEDPRFRGTESIQLWPSWADMEGWDRGSQVTGRVLAEKEGVTRTAPFYALEERSYRTESMFGGEDRRDLFAEFSFPVTGTGCRVYLTYILEEAEDGWLLSDWVNYTHQGSPIQFPAKTAAESRITDGLGRNGPFETWQNAIQFYPFDQENDELFGYEPH